MAREVLAKAHKPTLYPHDVWCTDFNENELKFRSADVTRKDVQIAKFDSITMYMAKNTIINTEVTCVFNESAFVQLAFSK